MPLIFIIKLAEDSTHPKGVQYRATIPKTIGNNTATGYSSLFLGKERKADMSKITDNSISVVEKLAQITGQPSPISSD